MAHYPDWYDQKARLKGNMWFKSLPSQTAQEVCKLVDKSWKSFYALIKSKGIQNPKPPRFKQSGMTITYMQNAIVHVSGSKRVRLSLPKQLKEYLKHTYDIGDNYLYLENKIFQNTDVIKQIKIYPPDRKNVCQVIVIYDVKDVEKMQDNGHYLSIDLGLHNLITCYDSAGTSFILGRRTSPVDGRRYPVRYKVINANSLRIDTQDTARIKLTVIPGPDPEDGWWYKFGQHATRIAMSVRNFSFTYKNTYAMTLPGFRPEVGDMFGQKKHGGFLAPGMDFAFGFTGDDYIDRALQNDWLICNDSVVSPASSNALEDLQLRISLEPIRN